MLRKEGREKSTKMESMLGILTATAVVFTMREPCAFAELTILRSPPLAEKQRKAMCVSEDDTGALVWNRELPRYWIGTNAPYQYRFNYMIKRNSTIDCQFIKTENCNGRWTQSKNWTMINSVNKPMGPVFDRRWEDFEEIPFTGNETYRKITEVNGTGTIQFSIRGSTTAYLLLCETAEYNSSFCYSVEIGKKLFMGKCKQGMKFNENKKKWGTCSEELEVTKGKESSLTPDKWKTITLEWSEEKQTVAIYDMGEKLVSKKFEEWKNPSHLYVTNSDLALYRFHIYDYLHATKANEILLSSEFNVTDSKLCIEMLIGLCAGCEIHVAILDMKNETYTNKIFKSERNSYGYDLPMWQHERINETVRVDVKKPVKLQVLTVLAKDNPKPLWAIANVQECKNENSVRSHLLRIPMYWHGKGYHWENYWCQQLSYDVGSLVSSNSNNRRNLKHDMPWCDYGKVGPNCAVSCTNIVKQDCKGLDICNDKGCMCGLGLQGPNCDKDCGNYYGYNCENKCGNCLRINDCHTRTGICRKGCKGNFLPPYCVKELKNPTPVNVTVREMSALITLNVEQYTQLDPGIRILIQVTDISKNPIEAVHSSQNETTLEEHYDNLEPGTFYMISVVVDAGNGNNLSLPRQSREFTTPCKQSENITLQPGETNLTLTITNEKMAEYRCPPSWYKVIFETLRGTNRSEIYMKSYSYTFLDLTPYTANNVTIMGGGKEIKFFMENTSEAAPSEVMNLSSTNVSEKGILLQWDQPKHPNGIITNYRISIKLTKLWGCYEKRVSTPETPEKIENVRNRQLALNDLLPYAEYNLTIRAYTSKPGWPTTKTFNTTASDIPTSVISNLRVEGNTIKWESPEDCTTISGPFSTVRLIFRGISSWVENFYDSRETKNLFFTFGSPTLNPVQKIYGATIYSVQVYIIRNSKQEIDNNPFQEQMFKTEPQAPPEVRDLDIYEINDKERNVLIRWLQPNPPLNGELENYHIDVCTSSRCNEVGTIGLDKYCDIWEKYICFEAKDVNYFNEIQVRAKNKDVKELGNISTIRIKTQVEVSEKPKNLTVIVSENGVVDLEWLHPWKTNSRLKSFIISIETISSDLRRDLNLSEKNFTKSHSVQHYNAKYNESFHLLPCTNYSVSVAAITSRGKGLLARELAVTPPALKFSNNISVHGEPDDRTFHLNVPKISNDIKHSMLYFILQGKIPCNELATPVSVELIKVININNFERAWITAKLSTKDIEMKQFTIGDNKTYRNVINCPLEPGETYTVVAIVKGVLNSTKHVEVPSNFLSVRMSSEKEKSMEWLIIIPIIAALALLSYISYRRRAVILQKFKSSDMIPLSQDPAILKHPNNARCRPKRPPPPNTKQSENTSNSEGVEFSDDTGCNPAQVEHTHSVKIKDFENYVKNAVANNVLENQYLVFPRGQTKPWDYGSLPQNKTKNRYRNMVAYDETRVVLEKLRNDPYSDYINANYIRGHNKEKAYIATQGPKPETVIDFWRMIWQENVLVICMLANIIENEKVKCEEYWPAIESKTIYGKVAVINIEQKVYADYTIRTFQVSCGEQTRKIEHLHYTAWPDHGVPLYTHSVISYLKKLRAVSRNGGPIVVHCSAGVGRTGTIILCDICLQRAAAEGVIDVHAETERIRSQRVNMVDNVQQYLLAHLVLVQYLAASRTEINCDETLVTAINEMKKEIPVQQRSLRDSAWQDEVLLPATLQRSLPTKNREKNRYPDIAPGNGQHNIFLKRFPITEQSSDYISAVYVDGVNKKQQFIASQLPLPSTLSDFWRLIAELRVELIVMLQSPDPDDPTCCEIIQDTEFNPVPFLKITAISQLDAECFTVEKLQLIDSSEKQKRTQSVTILQCKGWETGRNGKPASPETLVTLWQASEKISRGGPAAVLCHDGLTGCGLYLALSFLLERMATEGQCDVCLAIRAVRRSRQQFVQSEKQIEFLYDAAVKYSECFATYANFK